MKFTNIRVLGAALIGVMLSSCSSSSSDGVEYIPFRSSSNGGWGLIDAKGNVKYDGEFENTITGANHGAFFGETSDGQWILYSTSEKTPKAIGEPYSQALAFVADVAPVVKSGEKITLIKPNGEVVTTLDRIENVAVTECTNFKSGSLAVITLANGNSAVIDTKGNVIVAPAYKYISLYPGGIVICAKDDESEYANVLDKSGKELFTFKMDEVKELYDVNSNGIAVRVKSKDGSYRCGIKALDGKWKFEPTGRISEIVSLEKNYFVYRDKDYNYGVMDYSGEQVIPAQYEKLQAVRNTKTFVTYFSKEEVRDYEILNDKNEDLNRVPAESDKFIYNPIFPSVIFSESEDGMILMYDAKGKQIELKTTVRRVDFDCLGRESVRSEFVDVDGIIGALDITDSGFLGLKLGMTPKETLTETYKLYTSSNSSEEGHPKTEQEWSNPYDWRYNKGIDERIYLKDDDVSISYAINFPEKMTESNGETYTFTTIKSDVIGARVSDSYEICEKLFNVLKDKINPLGSKTYDYDDEFVVKSDKGYWCLVREGSSVTVLLSSDLDVIKKDYYLSSSKKYNYNKPWENQVMAVEAVEAYADTVVAEPVAVAEVVVAQ